MSRPTGRPSLGRKKRVHTLKLSFNDDEFDVIDIKASRAGMCKTVYGREAALNAEITGVLTDEEKMLLHELKKLGPNLNQVAHHANAEGFLSDAEAVNRLTYKRVQI